MPGTLSPEDVARLDAFHAMVAEQSKYFAGYPTTANFDYHDLFRFLDYPLNNIGDPFGPCTYHLHTRTPLASAVTVASKSSATRASPPTEKNSRPPLIDWTDTTASLAEA